MLELEISPKDTAELSTSEYLLIDVREEWEKQIADIGGRLIPLQSLPSILSEDLSHTRLVLYCHHGVRSLYGVQFLRSKGFDKAQSLSGGIDRWSKEVDETIPSY